MKVKGLPSREDAVVTVLPIAVTVCNDTVMRTFTLADVEYSLEEAIAIEGFLGFVHYVSDSKSQPVLEVHDNAVYRDSKGLPQAVIAVCFIKPTIKPKG